MKPRLFFSIGLLALAGVSGCGGNVDTGGNGGGGSGGGGATGTGTGGATTSTGTGTLPDAFTACDGPGQCTLALASCCAPCVVPELSDYAAVNVDQTGAYHDMICPVQPPCDACLGGYNPHLFAYCDVAAGKCVAADARTHAVSACTSADQCFLRGGTSCCESCDELDASELTALSTTAAPTLAELVCSPLAGACPPCAPTYPGLVEPTCGDDGHCQVLVIDK